MAPEPMETTPQPSNAAQASKLTKSDLSPPQTPKNNNNPPKASPCETPPGPISGYSNFNRLKIQTPSMLSQLTSR